MDSEGFMKWELKLARGISILPFLNSFCSFNPLRAVTVAHLISFQPRRPRAELMTGNWHLIEYALEMEKFLFQD